MLLFFRCTTFIGVCVEFVAAVAWLAELFPDPRQREKVLGYTQAFSSIGGLLVAWQRLIVTTLHLPAIAFPSFATAGAIARRASHAWRYTLMSGLIPAIPLIVIRPFLPGVAGVAAKKDAGTLQRPSIARAVLAPNCAGRHRHHDHVRVQLRRGVRRDPADAADRARAGRGRSADRRQAGSAQKQHRADRRAPTYTKVQEIGGLVGPVPAGDPGGADRQPPQRCCGFSWCPGLIVVPLVFFFCGDARA